MSVAVLPHYVAPLLLLLVLTRVPVAPGAGLANMTALGKRGADGGRYHTISQRIFVAGVSAVDAVAADTILEGDISSGGGGGNGNSGYAVVRGSAAVMMETATIASYSLTAAAPSVAATATDVWCYACTTLNLTDTNCEDPPRTGSLPIVPCPSGRCFKSTVTYHLHNIGGGAFYGRGCVSAAEAEAMAEETVCGVKSEKELHGTTESTECFCSSHLCNAAPPTAMKMETIKMALRLTLSTGGAQLLAAAVTVLQSAHLQVTSAKQRQMLSYLI